MEEFSGSTVVRTAVSLLWPRFNPWSRNCIRYPVKGPLWVWIKEYSLITCCHLNLLSQGNYCCFYSTCIQALTTDVEGSLETLSSWLFSGGAFGCWSGWLPRSYLEIPVSALRLAPYFCKKVSSCPISIMNVSWIQVKKGVGKRCAL